MVKKYSITILTLDKNDNGFMGIFDYPIESELFRIEKILVRDKTKLQGIDIQKRNLIEEYGDSFISDVFTSIIANKNNNNELLFVIDSVSEISLDNFVHLITTLDKDPQIECVIPRGNNNGVASYPRLSNLNKEQCLNAFNSVKNYLDDFIFTKIVYSYCFLLKLDFLRELNFTYNACNNSKLLLNSVLLNISNIEEYASRYDYLKEQANILKNDPNIVDKDSINLFLDKYFIEKKQDLSPFSIETYLLYNRDIVEAKVNPLTHFFIFGSKEDRFCFEEKYSDRYAASYILEYLFQIINMYGKVAIIDNCSFVYSQQLLSFDKEFEMIQKLNITNCQNWSNLLFQQFNAQSFLSNKIFSGFIPSNGKLKITLDFSNITCTYNGTSQVGMNFLKEISNKYKDYFEFDVIISQDAWDFHKIGESYKHIKKFEHSNNNFSCIFIKLGQPFSPKELVNLFSIAPIVTCFFYDCIALDCNYLYFKEWIWNYVIKYSSIIGTISQFSKEIIENRFQTKERIKIYNLPNFEKTFGESEDNIVHEYGDYIFVVGNSFAHKFVTETVSTLSVKFPSLNIVSTTNQIINTNNVKLLQPGVISKEKFSNIYNNALAIVYPSLYEGYGLPIIEAISRKKILFARDSSLNREVLNYISPEYRNYIILYKSTFDLQSFIQQIIIDKQEKTRYFNNVDIKESNVNNDFTWSSFSTSVMDDCINLLNSNSINKFLVNERTRFLSLVNEQNFDRNSIKCNLTKGFIELEVFYKRHNSIFSKVRQKFKVVDVFCDNLTIDFKEKVYLKKIKIKYIGQEFSLFTLKKILYINALGEKNDLLSVVKNKSLTDDFFIFQANNLKELNVENVKNVMCVSLKF